MIFFLLIFAVARLEVTETVYVFTQQGANVRVEFTETSNPQIDWSAFTDYTMEDCSAGITWTASGADLYHDFTHEEVITTCAFTLVSENNYQKVFTLWIDDGGTEYQEHFTMTLIVDTETSTVLSEGSTMIHESITDGAVTIEHGIAVSRVKNDWADWTDAPNEWKFNKGATAYFTVESSDVDFLSNPSGELRVDTGTTGINLGTITSNVVGDEIQMSLTVPNEDGMGLHKYIFFQFDVSESARRTDFDSHYAIYPFGISGAEFRGIAYGLFIPVICIAVIVSLILSGVVVWYLVKKYKMMKKHSYMQMQEG